jgi:catechol 2,3-dioxygenase-like lactoylglutathione lyase family enzyme
MASPRSTRDILIQTDRPDEARAFYEGVLDFAVFQDDPNMRGLETGAFRLFLDPGPPLGPVLEVLVDDLAAAKAKLLAAGCVVEQEDPAIPRCYVRDPFGLIFNLGQRSG